HWLGVKRVGKQSNRDGFGGRVGVKGGGLNGTAGGRAKSRFGSARGPPVPFGVGAAVRADSIVVRWPSGKVDTLGPRSADQELLIREGQGIVAGQAVTNNH